MRKNRAYSVKIEEVASLRVFCPCRTTCQAVEKGFDKLIGKGNDSILPAKASLVGFLCFSVPLDMEYNDAG